MSWTSRFILALTLLAGSVPSSAQANDEWLNTTSTVSSREVPPMWGFELRANPYRPAVGGSDERAFYKTMFESSKDKSLIKNQPMMLSLEVDWYAFNRFGLLGLFGRVGHWSVTGKTRTCHNDAGGEVPCTPSTVGDSTKGADTATLAITPLSLGVVYRMDLLKRKFGIPIVFNAKGGADYYLWSAKAAGKVSKTKTGSKTKGEGGTFGYSGALGIGFNLDWLDRDASTRSRASSGIADSYLFAEYGISQADGFGNSKKLDASYKALVIGVSLDFF